MGGRSTFDGGVEANAVRRLSLAEFEALRDAFGKCDPTGQGLKREEFTALVTSLTRTEGTLGAVQGWDKMLMLMFDLFDTDHGGSVSLREFVCGYSILSRGSQEDILRLLFHMFDADGSGELCEREVRKVISVVMALGEWMGERPLELSAEQMDGMVLAALAEADHDGDALLSYEEFEAWFLSEDILKEGLSVLSGTCGKSIDDLRREKEMDLIEVRMARLGMISSELEPRKSLGRTTASQKGRDARITGVDEALSQSPLRVSRSKMNFRSSKKDLHPFIIDYDSITFGRMIGRGAFAEVFEADWLQLPVAVKILHRGVNDKAQEEQREILLKEVALLGQLRHPNIVLYMGVCIDAKHPLCVVGELFNGGTLSDYILAHKEDLSVSSCLNLALCVARGMVYLHSSTPQILHRDLKSQNVLVSEDGSRAVITDFGLSRLDTGSDSRTDQPAGSAVTMAPEVAEGDQYTSAADVYSFAIVAWEIFYRDRPFSGLNPLQIMFRVAQGGRPEPITVRTIPEEVSSLIASCWAQDPTQRPEFSEIASVLRNCEIAQKA